MSMRLDRFMSATGVSSRSETPRIIKKGRITVNGVTAKRPDDKVDPENDEICLDGSPVIYREHTYIMLNKPQGYVSATEDRGLPTVLELLPPELRRGLFPSGRLDRDTVGLMLLTDDGELSHFLLSPVSHLPKTYFFRCETPLSEENAERLRAGVELKGDGMTKPAELTLADNGTEGRITITEGRYHQIKRMFAAVGNGITYLKRVSIGELSLDPSLPEGEWRYLTDEETASLRKHNRNRK